MSQRRQSAARSASSKRPAPRKPVTEQFGSNRLLRIGVILFASLIICSLVGSALVVVPLDALFGDGDSRDAENLASPNEDLIEELMAEVEDNPEDVDAILLLANVMGNSGRLSEAIAYYEQAVDLAPDDPSVRLDFARALADGGLQQDAELQFELALEMQSDNQEALYYLAGLYLEWDPPRTEEAIALLEQSIEVAPDTFIAEQAQSQLDSLSATPPPQSTLATPGGDDT